MTRNLHEILRGGYCTRWHANPDLAHIRETLAEHHARTAQIILALHPAPSMALLDTALHHDAGEPKVGDVPWPAKRDNPELAQLLNDAEDKAREGMGVIVGVDLSEADIRWLKMADRLSGYAHVAHVAPHLLPLADWQQDRDSILAMAHALGVRAAAAALLARLDAPKGMAN